MCVLHQLRVLTHQCGTTTQNGIHSFEWRSTRHYICLAHICNVRCVVVEHMKPVELRLPHLLCTCGTVGRRCDIHRWFFVLGGGWCAEITYYRERVKNSHATIVIGAEEKT